MNKYIDVIQRSLELLETLEEGFDYIRARMQVGEYEASIIMMQDVSVAYSVIERSLPPILEKIPSNKIKELGRELREAFTQLVAVYEQQAWGEAETTLSYALLPRYQVWKVELQKHLQPYVLS